MTPAKQYTLNITSHVHSYVARINVEQISDLRRASEILCQQYIPEFVPVE